MSDTPREQSPDEWMGQHKESRTWIAKTLKGVEICRAPTYEDARDMALDLTPSDTTFSVIEL